MLPCRGCPAGGGPTAAPPPGGPPERCPEEMAGGWLSTSWFPPQQLDGVGSMLLAAPPGAAEAGFAAGEGWQDRRQSWQRGGASLPLCTSHTAPVSLPCHLQTPVTPLLIKTWGWARGGAMLPIPIALPPTPCPQPGVSVPPPQLQRGRPSERAVSLLSVRL